MMRVLPYKMTSKSGKALAKALGVLRVRPDGNFRNNHDHTIVNWGYGGKIHFPHKDTLNPAWAVDNAANKLKSFRLFKEHGVPTPEWTTDPVIAEGWEGPVMARYLLRGHSGKGIALLSSDGAVRSSKRAPLYVKYVKKQDEYRYHVFNGSVIDVQQKKKRRDVDNEEVDYQVRNASSGWVYCRDAITPPHSLGAVAIRAVEALGLDFGAVDIIWNNHRGQGYVLEVNTAPGLEGSTLTTYVEAIREQSIHN